MQKSSKLRNYIMNKNTNILKSTLLIFLSTISLNAIEINKNKTFTIESEQENFQTTFRIASKAKTSHRIEATFNKIIRLSKKSDICTGGKYTISPRYVYKNSERHRDGYQGGVSFECTFQDQENYEDLIDKVKKVRDIQLTQNKINIVAKDKSKELEQISFQYANEYIHELHRYFRNCRVELIDVLNFQQPSPRPYMLRKSVRMQEDSSTSITTPIKKGLTQSLDVKYTFICQEKK